MSVGRPKLEIGTHGKIRFEKRPNGKYTATTMARAQNGKNKKISATKDTKAAAERAVKARVRALGDFVAANGGITIDSTVQELMTYWFEALEASLRRESTILTYKVHTRAHVLPYLKDFRISELSKRRLGNWLNEVAKTRGINRAKEARVVLNLALKEAVYDEFIAINPLESVRPLPPSPKKEVRALTLSELADVREALLENKRREKGLGAPIDDRLICWFEIMISNGARIGEVLALTRADIFLDEPKPFIAINRTLTRDSKGKYKLGTEPKTQSSKRLLPLSQEAVERLRYRIAQLNDLSPTALVFPTRYGTIWQPQTVRARMIRALEDAGLEHLKVHSHLFRKSIGTAITNSINIQTASVMLGHSDLRQTQRAYWKAPTPVELELGNALEIPKYRQIEVKLADFKDSENSTLEKKAEVIQLPLGDTLAELSAHTKEQYFSKGRTA